MLELRTLVSQPLPRLIWEHYLAQVWYELFVFIKLLRTGVIIEIAPGNSLKIAQALARLDFMGTLYLIEPHPKLALNIQKAYSHCLPKAKIIVVQRLLENALKDLPYSADALISNHSLDDMLIASLTPTSHFSALFDWAVIEENQLERKNKRSKIHKSKALKNEKPQTFRGENLWRQALKFGNDVNESCQYVLSIWKQSITTLQPKKVILSQYPSFALEQTGLTTLNQCALEILEGLRSSYVKQYVSHSFIQTVLNKVCTEQVYCDQVTKAKHWLVLHFS